jgi:hypothetical protein
VASFLIRRGDACEARREENDEQATPAAGRIEPTGEWEQIELLCGCAEQRDYVVFPPF